MYSLCAVARMEFAVVLGRLVCLPVAGRHRRQAGAPHRLLVATRRAIRPRLRLGQHRLRDHGHLCHAQARRLSVAHVRLVPLALRRLLHRPLADVCDRHAAIRPHRRHRGTVLHVLDTLHHGHIRRLLVVPNRMFVFIRMFHSFAFWLFWGAK